MTADSCLNVVDGNRSHCLTAIFIHYTGKFSEHSYIIKNAPRDSFIIKRIKSVD